MPRISRAGSQRRLRAQALTWHLRGSWPRTPPFANLRNLSPPIWLPEQRAFSPAETLYACDSCGVHRHGPQCLRCWHLHSVASIDCYSVSSEVVSDELLQAFEARARDKRLLAQLHPSKQRMIRTAPSRQHLTQHASKKVFLLNLSVQQHSL